MKNLAGSWQKGIEDALGDLGDFVPRLLLALGVFVVGWVLAIVLKKIVDLLMERFASHRDQSGAVATVAVRARRSIPRLVHLAIMLVTLWTAIEVIDPGSGESPAADFVDALRGLFLVLGLAGLFTVCTVLVVGVGGGLVRPMEDRWEAWLQRLAPAPYAEQSHPESPDADGAGPQQQTPREQQATREQQPGPEPQPEQEPKPTATRGHHPRPQNQQAPARYPDVSTAESDAGEGPGTARLPAVDGDPDRQATADVETEGSPDETQVLPATGRPRQR